MICLYMPPYCVPCKSAKKPSFVKKTHEKTMVSSSLIQPCFFFIENLRVVMQGLDCAEILLVGCRNSCSKVCSNGNPAFAP